MGLQQGPWGQASGNTFDMKEVTRITGLKVWTEDDLINGILFYYKKGEDILATPVYGSEKGIPTETQFGTEVLTGMGGTFDKEGESYVIYSLTFTTKYNGQEHQYSYGKPGGSKFDFQTSTSSVVGFFGWGGDKINAIGLYLA